MARKVPRDLETLVIDLAALACAVHNMLFSFCQNRPTFAHYSGTLFEIGLRYPASVLDVKNHLPSASCIRKKIQKLVQNGPQRF